MFFRVERCTWKLNISHQICFICRSECVWKHCTMCRPTPPTSRAPVTPQKHRRLSWDDTYCSYTCITQRLRLHGRKLQRPQIISGTAGRPICWMALGDLIDVAGISWEFKSMFSLLCVTGNGRREHVSISDPETNNCRECMDFAWTLIYQYSSGHCWDLFWYCRA